MNELYNKVCFNASKKTTTSYSTSFSSGILLFNRKIRQDIYNVYGFVRFADEIVDTYDGPEKAALLEEFRAETFHALERGVSFNPIIHAFQLTVKKHDIDLHLITAFLDSMEMDLSKRDYDRNQFDAYIYGSAEVIGLMCLAVFTHDKTEFEELKPYALALGSAFQKINFMRDMKSDYQDRGRIYFPQVEFSNFSSDEKAQIENEILKELDLARIGISKLPSRARFGVFLAYSYYNTLFNKIRNATPLELKAERIRVPNWHKAFIMMKVVCRVDQINPIKS